ncbi:hypothetical protein UlMin_029950 [Ulmus minor]
MRIVEGLMRLMEGEHVGPFNLGNLGQFTMLELAKVCLKKPKERCEILLIFPSIRAKKTK